MKPITIQDVAQAAGVAKTTASYALSGKGQLSSATRESVIKVAHELGFEPNFHAQRLSNGRCHDTIAIFASRLDLGVLAQKVQLIQRALVREGYRAPVFAGGYDVDNQPVSEEETKALLADVRRQKPVAVIVNSPSLGDAAWDELRRLCDEGGALVLYDHEFPQQSAQLQCDTVIFDREDNTYQAARHLLELGHRELGLFMPGQQQNFPFHPRFCGFARALSDFGLKPNVDWFFCGGQYEAGGATLAKRFLELSRRPSGMCIINDDAAVAFIAELGRAGVKVPDEVSVVSHDDLPIARYFPIQLTTVSHPVEEIAEAVVQILLERLRSPQKSPQTRVLRGQLYARQSATSIEIKKETS